MAKAEEKRAAEAKTTGKKGAAAAKKAPRKATRAKSPRKSARPKRTEGNPVIWAIGGGKGGVGKSILTSNLGVALARRGRRTVVIDADLGGANLHTLLGVENPKRTLSDFLNRTVDHIEDVLVDTPEPKLRLVSGSRALIGMANPRHSQKQKLLRQVRSLDCDHVVLDLSAGSAFNVLDFFLEARHPILVVVPEPTSIENAYHFLKSAFFRTLSEAAKHSPVKKAITQVLETKSRQRIRNPKELIEAVTALDPSAGEALLQRAKEFQPLLVVNQARTTQHAKLGHEIREACANYLGTQIEHLGTLERDESVRVAVGQRRPVLDLFPSCSFATDLEALAVRLLSRTDPDVMPPLVSGYGDDELELEDGSRAPAPSFSDLVRSARRSGACTQARARHEAEAPPVPEPRVPSRIALAAFPPTAPAPMREVDESSLAPIDLEQPGASLRRRRIELALELPEIQARTHIRHLEHIENEAFAMLPPEVYVRGYVLQYARALGIRDADALATHFVERYRRSLH